MATHFERCPTACSAGACQFGLGGEDKWWRAGPGVSVFFATSPPSRALSEHEDHLRHQRAGADCLLGRQYGPQPGLRNRRHHRGSGQWHGRPQCGGGNGRRCHGGDRRPCSRRVGRGAGRLRRIQRSSRDRGRLQAERRALRQLRRVLQRRVRQWRLRGRLQGRVRPLHAGRKLLLGDLQARRVRPVP